MHAPYLKNNGLVRQRGIKVPNAFAGLLIERAGGCRQSEAVKRDTPLQECHFLFFHLTVWTVFCVLWRQHCAPNAPMWAIFEERLAQTRSKQRRTPTLATCLIGPGVRHIPPELGLRHFSKLIDCGTLWETPERERTHTCACMTVKQWYP